MLKRLLSSALVAAASAVAIIVLLAPPIAVFAQSAPAKYQLNFYVGPYTTLSPQSYTTGDVVGVTNGGTTSYYVSLQYQAIGNIQPVTNAAYWGSLGSGGSASSAGGAAPYNSLLAYIANQLTTQSGCLYYSVGATPAGNAPGAGSSYWTQIGDCTGAAATVQTNLNTETTARTTADTNLQTNINNEATARQNGDTAIQATVAYSTVNVQAGATYTLAPGDCTRLGGLVKLTSASAVTVTLPAPTGGGNFPATCKTTIKNLQGSGFLATLTPVSGVTVDGNASYPIYNPGDATIVSDGTNWVLEGGSGVRGAGSLSTPNGIPYVSAAGVLGEATCPTTTGTYVLTEVPSGGSATVPNCTPINPALIGASLRSAPPTGHILGDSVWACLGTSGGTANCAPYRILAGLGVPSSSITTNALGGAGILYIANQQFQQQYAVASNTVTVTDGLQNNTTSAAPGYVFGNEAEMYTAYAATLAMAVDAAVVSPSNDASLQPAKTYANQATLTTGTDTASTNYPVQGRTCTATGGCTYTFYNVPGPDLFTIFEADYGATYYPTIVLDSGPAQYGVFNTYGVFEQFEETNGAITVANAPFAVHVSVPDADWGGAYLGYGTGRHTLAVTVPNGKTLIEVVGSYQGVSAAPPSVYISGLYRWYNVNDAALVAAGNQMLRMVSSELQQSGLNVSFADPSEYIDGYLNYTTSQWDTATGHPSNVGAALIAQANLTQAYPLMTPKNSQISTGYEHPAGWKYQTNGAGPNVLFYAYAGEEAVLLTANAQGYINAGKPGLTKILNICNGASLSYVFTFPSAVKIYSAAGAAITTTTPASATCNMFQITADVRPSNGQQLWTGTPLAQGVPY